ncbi:MAG: sterol desaturase family protein [Rhodospirillales bacterium]
MTVSSWLLAHESALRLAAFAGVLVLMSGLEALWPRRVRGRPRAGRWSANIGVVVIAAMLARAVMPLLPVGAALWAEARGFGLFNALEIPLVIAVPAAVVLLDLAIYAQHVLFHKVPVLWRLHRMHHSDVDLDATSGVRFHPVEIILSLMIKIVLAVLLGAPAAAVMIFELLLNTTAMFSHANLNLPARADAALRRVIVTPDMHRVHHSTLRAEHDTNYGFNLSIWDRLFGTYTAEPGGGHTGMTLGLDDFRDPAVQRLDKLLMQPFSKS